MKLINDMKQITRIAMLWLAVAMACPVLTSCDAFWAWYERPVNPQVRVAKNALTIVVGQTAQCNATAQEHIALTYASADPEVATVDQTGLITANKVGTTQITIHAEGDDEYWRTQIFGQRDLTIDVEVVPTPAAPVVKTPAAISFADATKEWGTKDGKIIITPDNTGDGTVTYISSDQNVASIDPTTGEITPGTPGTTTITAIVADTETYTYASKTAQYTLTIHAGYRVRKYNTSTKQFDIVYETTGTLLDDAAGDVTIYGTCIVKGNVTINGKLNLSANTELILLDGSQLTVNGGVDSGTTYSLTIFAQSDGTSAGKLNVNNPNDDAISVNNLTIHGGKIDAIATNTTSGYLGITTGGNITIFGGDIKVQSSDVSISAVNIGFITYNLLMTGGKLDAAAGNSSGTVGYEGAYIGNELSLSGDAVLIVKGSNCISGGKRGGDGIKIVNSLIISDNASITATGGHGNGLSKGGMGIRMSNNIEYRGGTITTSGGLNGDNATRQKAMNNGITNNSGSTLYYDFSGTAIPTTLSNHVDNGSTISVPATNNAYFKCSK